MDTEKGLCFARVDLVPTRRTSGFVTVQFKEVE